MGKLGFVHVQIESETRYSGVRYFFPLRPSRGSFGKSSKGQALGPAGFMATFESGRLDCTAGQPSKALGLRSWSAFRHRRAGRKTGSTPPKSLKTRHSATICEKEGCRQHAGTKAIPSFSGKSGVGFSSWTSSVRIRSRAFLTRYVTSSYVYFSFPLPLPILTVFVVGVWSWRAPPKTHDSY